MSHRANFTSAGSMSSHTNSNDDGNESPAKRSRNDSGPTYVRQGGGFTMQTTSTQPTFVHQPTIQLPISPTTSNTNGLAPMNIDSGVTAGATSSPLSPTTPRPPRTCLLVIDVQNDFVSGSLKAPDALSIIPVINQLRVGFQWDLVVFTADAHPTNHVSFYINHAKDPKAQLFKPYVLPSGMVQVLWPVHCVRDTYGAQLHNDLIKDPTTDIIVEKGTEVDQEFYSAFVCTDGIHRTNLSSILQQHGITHVAACGLVYEFCVGNSACDAAAEGFQTCVVTDATRGLTQEAMQVMTEKMERAGVSLATSQTLQQFGYKPKVHISASPQRVISTLSTPPPARSPTNGAFNARQMQHPMVQSHYMAQQQHQHYPTSPHHPLSRAHSTNSGSNGVSEYNLSGLSNLSTPTSSNLTSSAPTPRLSPVHSRVTSAYGNAAASPTNSPPAAASSLAHTSSSNSTISAGFSFGQGTAPPAAAGQSTQPSRAHILLGLSGSVASIKATELLTLLCSWADVRVICTGRSKHFFSSTEIQTQFGVQVYEDEDEWKPWKRGDSVLHVDLRRWADILLVAPLSANTLAKISHGLCDNLLTTVIRCWSFETHPLILAPAMNTVMWESPFTHQQLEMMTKLGNQVAIIYPISKKLACGDTGKGAMASVDEIDLQCRKVWKQQETNPTARQAQTAR